MVVLLVSTEVNAPLLSLVPLPAFTMDEIVVESTMDISDQFSTNNSYDLSETKTSTTTDNHQEKPNIGGGVFNLVGYNGFIHKEWNNTTIVKWKVTAHRKNIRKTNASAKYTIKARAVQQPASD